MKTVPVSPVPVKQYLVNEKKHLRSIAKKTHQK